MYKTIFLTDEDYNFKELNSLNVKYLSFEKVSKKIPEKKIHNEITKKTFHSNFFSFSQGNVYLNQLDHVYILEFMPHSSDIILPKNPKTSNWIVLFYSQLDIIHNISYDKKTPILLRGNGQKIMGLNEPLLCDIPFVSLKLVYLDNFSGWVIV
jgi:hypothetical protein